VRPRALPRKTLSVLWIIGAGRVQKFQRHIALQAGVVGAIDHTHAPGREALDDAIVAHALTGLERVGFELPGRGSDAVEEGTRLRFGVEQRVNLRGYLRNIGGEFN
jgi:hypothetical protein